MNTLIQLAVCVILAGSSNGLLTCHQVNVDECLRPFQKDFDAGVEVLKGADDTTIGQICWKYHLVSKCLVPIIYYCPEIKDRLQKTVEEFEYFCANAPHKSHDGWPVKPTFQPEDTDTLIQEAEAEKSREKTIDSAIKAGVAAGVTVLLVLVCVIVDCLSRWKIRRRVQKAVAASAAIQADQQLLKEEEGETDDETRTDSSPKKV